LAVAAVLSLLDAEEQQDEAVGVRTAAADGYDSRDSWSD